MYERVTRMMTRQSALRTSRVQPDVRAASGRFRLPNVTDCGSVARLEWRVGDAGDPAVACVTFLARFGLGLPGAAVNASDSRRERSRRRSAARAVRLGGGRGRDARRARCRRRARARCRRCRTSWSWSTRHAADQRPRSGRHERCRAPAGARTRGGRAGRRGEHAGAVESRARRRSPAGDVYQVNVVGHASAPVPRRSAARAAPGHRAARRALPGPAGRRRLGAGLRVAGDARAGRRRRRSRPGRSRAPGRPPRPAGGSCSPRPRSAPSTS